MGSKKSSAARRKRLLLRLGGVVGVVLLILLVARARNSSRGGISTGSLPYYEGEDVPAEHMKSGDTAAAAEKR